MFYCCFVIYEIYLFVLAILLKSCWLLKVLEMLDQSEACVICGGTERSQNKFLICFNCSCATHSKCRKTTVGSTQSKHSKHFCSVRCVNEYNHSGKTRNINMPMISFVNTELKTAIMNETHNMKESVRSVTSAIERSQEFLASKFDSILDEFKKLKEENSLLKLELQNLKSTHSFLVNVVRKLEVNSDKIDKSGVANNAIFHGIPQSKNENVHAIISNVVNNVLDVNLPSDAIVSASRMYTSGVESNSMRPVRVVFKDTASKDQVLLKKKQIGKVSSTMIDSRISQTGRSINVVIRDELTPLSSVLFKEICKNRSKLHIKYVWTGKGGVVLVRRDDKSKPLSIKSRDDLDRLFRQPNLKTTTVKPLH